MATPVPQPRRPRRPRCSRRRRRPLTVTLAVVSGVVAWGAGLARADDRAGHESLNLPAGSLRISASLEVGLDVRSLGAPVSLAPDVYVGVTPRLTLGMIHSGRALGLIDSGRGLCVSGRSGGCDPVYSGTGLDGWYTLLRAPGFELATRTRVYAARFSGPLKLRVTLGLQGVFRVGPVALRFDPHLSVGLVNRELGNADTLNVPIQLFLALGRYVAIYLRTGLRGLLNNFAEQYAVPLGLGVLVRPSARWQVGAQVVFRQLLGPLNTHQKRDLLFYADYRFTPLF
ncbi:MAG: hypothetical protein ABI333_15320 [bacterium]